MKASVLAGMMMVWLSLSAVEGVSVSADSGCGAEVAATDQI